MVEASATLAAIDAALARDGGDLYRANLRRRMAECHDAYRPSGSSFRRGLGASAIGHGCLRHLWYAFHWVRERSVAPRMLRLLNRGHIEEARLLALLDCLEGVTVWAGGSDGAQFRRTTMGGFVTSVIDGVAIGLPDLPGEYCMLEFKTANDASFTKLASDGVRAAKPDHYAQIQLGMALHGLGHALYLATCKNTDRLHGELLTRHDAEIGFLMLKAQAAVGDDAPPRASPSPEWRMCVWCDYRSICFGGEAKAVNCRSCVHFTTRQGRADCALHGVALERQTQLRGCANWKAREDDTCDLAFKPTQRP